MRISIYCIRYAGSPARLLALTDHQRTVFTLEDVAVWGDNHSLHHVLDGFGVSEETWLVQQGHFESCRLRQLLYSRTIAQHNHVGRDRLRTIPTLRPVQDVRHSPHVSLDVPGEARHGSSVHEPHLPRLCSPQHLIDHLVRLRDPLRREIGASRLCPRRPSERFACDPRLEVRDLRPFDLVAGILVDLLLRVLVEEEAAAPVHIAREHEVPEVHGKHVEPLVMLRLLGVGVDPCP
mmetsp:Transcript_40790/g.128507  ORF Transcript_40790/g.128507 Transcript_40790/m.128507 type:complete len:235 (-) Transcript_40790:291-995(-)